MHVAIPAPCPSTLHTYTPRDVPHHHGAFCFDPPSHISDFVVVALRYLFTRFSFHSPTVPLRLRLHTAFVRCRLYVPHIRLHSISCSLRFTFTTLVPDRVPRSRFPFTPQNLPADLPALPRLILHVTYVTLLRSPICPHVFSLRLPHVPLNLPLPHTTLQHLLLFGYVCTTFLTLRFGHVLYRLRTILHGCGWLISRLRITFGLLFIRLIFVYVTICYLVTAVHVYTFHAIRCLHCCYVFGIPPIAR